MKSRKFLVVCLFVSLTGVQVSSAQNESLQLLSLNGPVTVQDLESLPQAMPRPNRPDHRQSILQKESSLELPNDPFQMAPRAPNSVPANVSSQSRTQPTLTELLASEGSGTRVPREYPSDNPFLNSQQPTQPPIEYRETQPRNQESLPPGVIPEAIPLSYNQPAIQPAYAEQGSDYPILIPGEPDTQAPLVVPQQVDPRVLVSPETLPRQGVPTGVLPRNPRPAFIPPSGYVPYGGLGVNREYEQLRTRTQYPDYRDERIRRAIQIERELQYLRLQRIMTEIRYAVPVLPAPRYCPRTGRRIYP